MSGGEKPVCVAIAVVQAEGRFLVGVRPEGAPLAGYCEFPGGKVEAGETPAEAAARECLEESGLAVEVGEEYFCTTHEYAHGVLEVHFFECWPRDDAALPRGPFRWVEGAELASLRFPAANARLTEMLLRKLQGAKEKG